MMHDLDQRAVANNPNDHINPGIMTTLIRE